MDDFKERLEALHQRESEKLTPERAVRLLRAKVGELEAKVLAHGYAGIAGGMSAADELRADIALIAQLLADHIEGGR
jgi:hypothetical protein